MPGSFARLAVPRPAFLATVRHAGQAGYLKLDQGGALPIAHRTGGLADTIADGETGFLFSDLSGEGLLGACRRAFDAFDDPALLHEMRQAAMARSFQWTEAAEAYELLYSKLIGRQLAQVVPATPRRRVRRLPVDS